MWQGGSKHRSARCYGQPAVRRRCSFGQVSSGLSCLVLEICSLAELPGPCSLAEFNWHLETQRSSGRSCLEQGGCTTGLGCLKGKFIPQEKVTSCLACVDAAGSLRCVSLPLPRTGAEATTTASACGAAGVTSLAGLLVWKGSLELGFCSPSYSLG